MRCHSDRETIMTHEDPRQVLEIEAEAGEEEIRAAYLRKVKQYPPDRSPREFERVRDAYDMLRDPRLRTRSMLLAADPKQPLASLLDGLKPQRQFTGPDAWLAVSRVFQRHDCLSVKMAPHRRRKPGGIVPFFGSAPCRR